MKKIELKNYIYLDKIENIRILEIRNEKFNREVSLNQNIISLNDHTDFVKNLKKSSKKYFAIIYEDEICGGLNYFDVENEIKWGMFFSQECSLLIKSILPMFFMEYIFTNLEKEYIFLEVKNDNINAISFNKNLGFDILKEKNNIITMKMSIDKFEKAKEKMFLKRVLKQLQKFEIEVKE